MSPAKFEWTILNSCLDLGDDLLYGADDIFMTSTPDATAVFEDSLPLSLMAPGPPLDALSALISVTAKPSMPLPELIHVYVPDPQLTPAAPASAPDMTTPQPLSVPSCEATATSTPAPLPEPISRPPLRAPCGIKCRRQCSAKFSEDHRRKIWRDFWDLTYQEKRAFVFHCVSQVTRAKVCANPSRRSRSFIYRLKDAGGNPQQVCKLFFLSTLGYHPTNDSIVLSVMGK